MADNPAITAEMICVWCTLKEIVDAGADRQWESEGGRLAEYYAANTRLDNELLGMMPHETPPIRARVYGRPPASLHDDAAWKRSGCASDLAKRKLPACVSAVGVAGQGRCRQPSRCSLTRETDSGKRT